MKLTLVCEHGTRAVEFDDLREGIGADDYAKRRLLALQPRCPYCDLAWMPPIAMSLQPQPGVAA